ncbi:hypothetical protein NJT12_03120 [Flavobacterium sp. AC]|uniref:Lipoprotein n=1 Tax=Flavobacterium azizsancarii TaxID=2961580 RepID=A0ABT4W7T9_9FLAO|nr:hypothetical protein [Flavobacterium azizsancarii]MDA6068602.1 hypothetical protein [Flavobacterium azizsancarii]
MKNIILTFLVFSILVSCKDDKLVKSQKSQIPVKTQIVKDSVVRDEDIVDEDVKNDFEILLPDGYRDDQGKNPANSLNKNWIDLFEEAGTYYLGKADFTIEKGFDECVGDSLRSIVSKNKSLLFMDYPELKLGKIKSLKLAKNKIWPGEKVTLKFDDTDYVFRAEGKVLSTEKRSLDDNKQEIYKKVENYKLYLKANNGPEKLLLQVETFNDTFVELLFAGDIDNDGKLDFIFGANRDYEETRVMLFLSSKSENDEPVKKVSQIAIQFDC